MRLVLALTGLVLALSGCAATSSATSFADDSTPLQNAYDACSGKKGGDTLDLGDAGHSMFIDTGSEGQIKGAVCVFVHIGTPDRIVNEMDSTTALMGRQHAEDGDMKYDWSYHPDNGMNLVISDQ